MSFIPNYFMRNQENINSPGEAFGVLGLLYEASELAQNSEKIYGAQEKDVPSDASQHRYVLVQCSRDLNSNSCNSCLKEIIDQIGSCCQGEGRVALLNPSCLSRYEEYTFFQRNSGAPQPVPPAR
ncbi:hypothetical protein SLE2022_014760 [Rubroshorea leprosula]